MGNASSEPGFPVLNKRFAVEIGHRAEIHHALGVRAAIPLPAGCRFVFQLVEIVDIYFWHGLWFKCEPECFGKGDYQDSQRQPKMGDKDARRAENHQGAGHPIEMG